MQVERGLRILQQGFSSGYPTTRHGLRGLNEDYNHGGPKECLEHFGVH